MSSLDPDRARHEALRRGSRVVAAGLFVAAAGRLFDDAGLFVGLTTFDGSVVEAVEARTWIWALYFGGLALAAGWLIPRQQPGLRRGFVAGCATLLSIDLLVFGGFSAWTFLGLLAVGWGGLRACIEGGDARVPER